MVSERGSVAYVLKGFPRLSEIFIASEIQRVEQAGISVRLIVLKPADEVVRHPVVERIRARPHHLPRAEWARGMPAWRWLSLHLGKFAPSVRRVARRRPAGLARAAAAALGQAVRARRTRWSWPRKVCLKELLQAAAVADEVLRAGDVRHLHGHFAHGAATVTWLAALMTGLPFSFTGHAKDIYTERLNPAGLLRRKLDAARFVVTCTEANRRYLEGLGSRTPVHRVYHGVNADFARLLVGDEQPAPVNGRVQILAVGRLVEKKGFDVLVEACGLLDHMGLPFAARLVGEDGEHAPGVRRRIGELGLDDKVLLVGAKDQAGLYDEYRAAHLFCLPCRVLGNGDRDGLPNVLLEAMACGLPVVTTAVSGIPELVTDGSNGLLVSPDRPDQVAAAIVRLQGDSALAASLSAQAKETVRRRFDGDTLARQLVDLFEGAGP